MNQGLPDQLLARLSELVAQKTALHFPPARWYDLERRLVPAARELGFDDQSSFVQWLTSTRLSNSQVEILASHLTIGETYFWRAPQVFEALESHILPQLIQARQNGVRCLRIWSAACATGEEPYSIAIALCRALPSPKNWRVNILATDINPHLLRKARLGVYGQWSFRNSPAWLKQDYFRPTNDGRLEILPKIREMVAFSYLNLAEDVYPSVTSSTNAMDIIFCRNVLMYFLPERARQVVANLQRCLVNGGWLAVGACESWSESLAGLTTVRFPGAVLYQKLGAEAKPSYPPVTVKRETHRQIPPRPRLPYAPQPSAPLDVRPPVIPPDKAPVLAAAQHAPEARDNTEAILSMANQGLLAEAMALCEIALSADKLDPSLHYLRATILLEQEHPEEASASLRRVLYIDPNFTLAHFALGNLLLRQGDLPGAKRCFYNVIDLLADSPMDQVLAEAEGMTVGRLREITQAIALVAGTA